MSIIFEPVDGIEVPSHKIEVVFVPLLAFDKQGQRVGYGKGFYDKFLAECSPKVNRRLGEAAYENTGT
jgi:5-formyltetrahydrofolate cyclo-ligase